MDVKAFFAYSQSIFLARITAFTGFIVAAFGAIDWSPLLSLNIDTGLTQKQVIWMGILVFAKGVIDEVARRMKGATTL